MTFTDTHTHLYDEAFDGEEDLAVARAVDAGVTRMILPDIDSKTRQPMLDLADRHQGTLFPCIGLHPTSVDALWQEEMLLMEKHLDRKIWAIGEIGMDCYWSREFIREQEEVLRIQLETAARMSLPVIIHSRESTELIINILKDCSHLGLRGVFHAFSGSAETFRELQKTGDWYIGIGGVLTYRKASIAETVRQIPLERILLETDSPYLTPVPFRGKRNESSYIPHIATRLAELQGTDISEVAHTTTENARKLFGI
ncbi:MAG: TatD family hydrolase [Bacteroidales bacterium]|jgi:TatD DNase family protein|nr:TatD family hydrolase [Bacteroidales bacterium]